jgi:hypothetical protein
MKGDLLLTEPRSAELSEEFLKAYTALSEPEKKRLLREMHKGSPGSIGKLSKECGLRGASVPKVLSRSGNYGVLIDRWLTSPESGIFLSSACVHFLRTATNFSEMISSLPDNPAEELLSSHIRHHSNDELDGRLVDLAAAWILAYVNRDGEEFATIKSNYDSYNVAVAESRDPLNQLDEAADELRQLTEAISHGLPVIDDAWNQALSRAKNIIGAIDSEVASLCEKAGAEPRVWTTRDELQILLSELRQLAEETGAKADIASFLKDLATHVTALSPKHKLASKRKTQEQVRAKAAAELGSAAESEGPRWIEIGPRDANTWLQWITSITADELETVVDQLIATEYPDTADLCADLETSFDFPKQTQANVSEASERATTKPSLQQNQQPLAALATVSDDVSRADQREKEEKAKAAVEQKSQQTPPTEPAKQRPLETEVVAAETQDNKAPDVSEVSQPADELVALPEDKSARLQEMAKAVLESSDEYIEERSNRLLWLLLENNERQLAWHLLKAAIDEKGMTKAFPLPPEALEILALMPFYAAEFPEVTDRVRDLLAVLSTDIFKEGERSDNALRQLILAAITFQPALQDKASNGAELLKNIKLGKLKHIQKAQVAVQEFASTTIQISPTILSSALNSQSWGDGEVRIIDELRAFRETAPKRTITFTPAMRVWRGWFVRNGLLASLFELGETRSAKSIEELRVQLEQIDIDSEIDSAITGKFSLTGTALAQLQRLGQEACRLLSRRVEHYLANPENKNDHRKAVIQKLRAAFEGATAQAQADITDYASRDLPKGEQASIACSLLVTEIKRIEEFLTGRSPQLAPVDLQLILNADLLRVHGLEIDELWQAANGENRFEAIVKGLTQPLYDWQEAFHVALEKKDHLAARRIMDRMTVDGDLTAVDELEELKKEKLRYHRAEIADLIAVRETETGAALAKGWLLADTFSKLSDQIQELRNKLEESGAPADEPFNLWEKRLSVVRDTVQKGRERQKHDLFAQLEALEHGSQEDKGKVRLALDENDFSLAEDYLTQLRDDGLIQPRHESLRGHIFTEFFEAQESVESIESQLYRFLTDSKFNSVKLPSAVSSGAEVCGLRLDDAGQRVEAKNALSLWFEWARDQNSTEERVAAMVPYLGFPIPKVHKRTPGSFEAVLTTPVECPVPDFGSELKGKICVLCDTRSTSAEDALAAIIRHGIAARPTLLLWFKPVSTATRRAFARICRDKSYKVLLVDTVLALFLFLRGSEKLRTLFECSLPFTTVSPYSSAGGNLPDEMFFGRRNEMRKIESRSSDGACFVYGGRQIGKTVLLKKVARDFAAVSKKQLSLYLDLNSYAVGTESSMDDVWRIMSEELHRKDETIFGTKINRQMSPTNFRESVKTWLTQDPERRILILLDEADAMLTADGSSEVDGQQFRLLHQLKGLMDDTDRRFKVVFAGLHNVQRTTREPNNPLVQLGSPICVRPLMHNGEAKEAFRLVAEPLRVCGASIEQLESTVNSMLARTNYYPNLIQIVSDRLLKTAIDRQLMAHTKSCPPYRIQRQLMEDMFNAREVRAELQQKLLLTLDLDKRYYLIANIVAFYRKYKPEGMTAEEIAQEAKASWMDGFTPDPRTSQDEERYQFKILLEEMCGLGVLRETKDGVFTLRSTNVAVLLGADEETASVIDSASAWDPPSPYSPETFRGTDKKGNQSPLTAKQESVLLDQSRNAKHVHVVLGPRAAGFDDVPTRLREKLRGKTKDEFIKELAPDSKHDDFEHELSELIKSRREGKTLLLVPETCPWDLKWIQTAKNRLSKTFSENKPASVVFLTDPDALWELLHQWGDIQAALVDGAEADGARDSVLRLGPYSKSALKKFILDTGKMLSNPETMALITDATGLWRTPLLSLRKFMSEADWRAESLRNGAFREKLAKDGHDPVSLFGIKDDQRKAVLEALAELIPLGATPISEFVAYAGNERKVSSDQIAKVIEWGVALGIINRRNDEISIDSFLGSQLTTAAPA